MLKCLNNDSKLQMRQNIKLHRQKLLQYLENTNDTVLKPKIKLVSNDIEKYKLNHNVKPKITSSTELLNTKLKPTIKVTNHTTRSNTRVKKFEPVINTVPKNLKVLTDIHVKEHNTRSSVTANQLQPDVKVKKKEELPLSNVELQLKPILNIEIKDPKSPPVIVKKLKEQLIEELFDSSSSEEIDDNISVGNNEDFNDIFLTHNESNVDENDSSSSSLTEAVKYDKHKQLTNNKSKEEHLYNSSDSDNSVFDYPTTKKRSLPKNKILPKPQDKFDQPKHRFRKPQDRSLHNAKERACRERIAKKFAILRKSCSYLNTNRRVPSKHSILLAAKKECDLLKHFEKKMIAEKKVWRKSNEILKNRIVEMYRKDYQDNRLAHSNL